MNLRREKTLHWVKSVKIRGFFWSIVSCIQSEYRKNADQNTGKTPYLDTFHAVLCTETYKTSDIFYSSKPIIKCWKVITVIAESANIRHQDNRLSQKQNKISS